MYKLRLYNPLTNRHEYLLEMPDMSFGQAVKTGEKFLAQLGIARADIMEEILAGDAIAYPEQKSAIEVEGGWNFIPNNNAYFFLRHIKDTLDLQVEWFLVLGCGPGNTLRAGNAIFEPQVCVGVEYDPLLCAQADENTRDFHAYVLMADAREWTPAVNDFDLVYMSDLFRDLNAASALWEHLKSWLKNGQYFFYHRATGEVPNWLKPVGLPEINIPCLYTVEK